MQAFAGQVAALMSNVKSDENERTTLRNGE
jgi:hypothetical protein